MDHPEPVNCRRDFLRAFAIGAGLLLVVCFTPLASLALMFGAMTTSWQAAVLVLFIVGAPVAGFGFAALTALWSPRKAARWACQLAGMWLGLLLVGRVALEVAT